MAAAEEDDCYKALQIGPPGDAPRGHRARPCAIHRHPDGGGAICWAWNGSATRTPRWRERTQARTGKADDDTDGNGAKSLPGRGGNSLWRENARRMCSAAPPARCAAVRRLRNRSIAVRALADNRRLWHTVVNLMQDPANALPQEFARRHRFARHRGAAGNGQRRARLQLPDRGQ